jgi:hypothetical protein
MPATTGMKGAGYYDRHSAAQFGAIQALEAWVDDAIADMPLPPAGQPVTVVDLGCSEGGNAVRLMAAVVAGLRQRRTGQAVQTVYSDLPTNDFNRLFANLEQARQAGLVPADVYAAAVAGSFYNPLLPPGSVHLATCFNAIQWLDQLPAVHLHDHVAYRRPRPARPGSADSAEAAAAFTGQAEQDLVRFLESRAEELVPGGKLLLASPGDTDQVSVSDGFADLLNDACLDLIAAGRLERESYERLVMPVYFRTVAELRAPLEQDGSPVRGAFAVERARAMEVPTPFIAEFRRAGDVTAYAAAYVGFARAITEPVVRAAFDPSGTATSLVEQLYERMRSRLLAEPERYTWRYILAAILLTRR